MNSEALIKYIEHPESIGEPNVFDLTLLADQYPFFQSAQLLRIKCLHNLSPKGIEPVLNFTAAYVTDRKVLYYLLHPLKELSTTKEQKSSEKEIKDSMVENISDTLTNQLNYGDSDFDSELEFTSSIDVKKEYGQGLELNEYVVRITDDGPELMELLNDTSIVENDNNTQPETEDKEDLLHLIHRGSVSNAEIESDFLSESQKKHNALIDNFITLNPKIVPQASSKENIDVSQNSVQENDHYLTDTLAQIYLKQGNYAKAIFAYEKLSLKFPEKSSYFAGQIAEIKKLIDKTK